MSLEEKLTEYLKNFEYDWQIRVAAAVTGKLQAVCPTRPMWNLDETKQAILEAVGDIVPLPDEECDDFSDGWNACRDAILEKLS